MRPLWLDYQRADPDRRRPGVLLLGAGALVAGLVFGHFADLVDRVEESTRELTRIERTVARDLEQDLAATAARAGSAAAHTAAEWESLFVALETASGERVTLLALRPGASEIVIAGEASDLAASTDYIRRLQAAPGLTDVHLTSAAPVVDHPQQPVRFDLRAAWPGQSGPPPPRARQPAQEPELDRD